MRLSHGLPCTLSSLQIRSSSAPVPLRCGGARGRVLPEVPPATSTGRSRRHSDRARLVFCRGGHAVPHVPLPCRQAWAPADQNPPPNVRKAPYAAPFAHHSPSGRSWVQTPAEAFIVPNNIEMGSPNGDVPLWGGEGPGAGSNCHRGRDAQGRFRFGRASIRAHSPPSPRPPSPSTLSCDAGPPCHESRPIGGGDGAAPGDPGRLDVRSGPRPAPSPGPLKPVTVPRHGPLPPPPPPLKHRQTVGRCCRGQRRSCSRPPGP